MRDIARLDSRLEAGFQAFSCEVDELREELSESIDGQDKDLKEWTGSKLYSGEHTAERLEGVCDGR